MDEYFAKLWSERCGFRTPAGEFVIIPVHEEEEEEERED
jgi:hypothetical protein